VAGSPPRLAVVGGCNVDLVVEVTRLPRPGETVLGGDVARWPGGKGANQAAAAARLGATTTLFATVGDDESGAWLLESLHATGVDTRQVARSRRPTGSAFITVTPAGENEIVVSSGANADLDLSGVDLAGYDVVLTQLEVAATVVDEAVARAACSVLNVAPAVPVSDETLDRCTVVIANEVEADALDLARLGHCVLTLGARGAVHLSHGREVARAMAPAVDVIDTVGAGDAFCAAYAVRFAAGDDAEAALRFAVVAGSLATTARGAQGALPTTEEVEAWLARGS